MAGRFARVERLAITARRFLVIPAGFQDSGVVIRHPSPIYGALRLVRDLQSLFEVHSRVADSSRRMGQAPLDSFN